MTGRFFCLLLCLVFFLPAGARAQEVFFEALGDVPVLPGLMPLPERTLAFDKPEGRIARVEALVQEPGKEGDILALYQESLPQLGWHRAGPGIYRREGQKLTVSRAPGPGPVMIVFLLEPG